MTIHGVGIPASLTPIKVLVIDRSRAAECKILVHLENAGHQIIHARDENAMIELLLASVDETPEDRCLNYSGVSVEPENRTVHVHGIAVELSRLEFEFLLALIETPMRVLTHGELAERVWGNYDVGLKAISVLASRLRRRVIDAQQRHDGRDVARSRGRRVLPWRYERGGHGANARADDDAARQRGGRGRRRAG